LPKETAIVVAALAIVLFLRLQQKHFLKDDPLFLKRFMLSASAGLFLLVVINKLIMAPALAPLSIPFGLGAFTIYAFEPMGDKPIAPALILWLRPVVLCCLAFVSLKLYGLTGVIVIIPTFFLSALHQCKRSETAHQK
jgi:hypothetical protein